MFRFKFFVHCTGWKGGGYENSHYARSEKEAHEIVDNWNAEYKANGNDCRVELLEIEKMSDEEWLEDCMCFD
jgi:hypothetical protein